MSSTDEHAPRELTRASELLELLYIEFDEIASTRVSGSVAADERHHQPWGIVHGGLFTVRDAAAHLDGSAPRSLAGTQRPEHPTR